MGGRYAMKEVAALAGRCILLGKEKRPELPWIMERYECVQKRHHLKNKKETDRFLYEKMYGHAEQKPTELLKIRYWRTGKFVPGSRKQCVLFGKALELEEEELRFMLRGYCDRCEDIFETAESRRDVRYRKRREYLNKIIGEYMGRIPVEKFESLHIPGKKANMFFRHLYYTDAFHYVDTSVKYDEDIMKKHITSYSYHSEFSRQMELRGEIPRKVFIRHLLILGMPDLTLEKLNRQLLFFGYHGLDEGHTMVRGERLDWLLIRLMKMYGEMLEKEEREACLQWFRAACRTLDGVFRDAGYHRLRFMYFKALKG